MPPTAPRSCSPIAAKLRSRMHGATSCRPSAFTEAAMAADAGRCASLCSSAAAVTLLEFAIRGHVLDPSGPGSRIFCADPGWSEAKSGTGRSAYDIAPRISLRSIRATIPCVWLTSPPRNSYRTSWPAELHQKHRMERMRGQALQSIAPAKISRDEALAKSLLALNNAHAQELSWLEPARLGTMVVQE